ncbi:MAG TPA: DUF3108 domain-containing protein [Acidobacteriota bacterium]|jgi:hypothetical protein
MGKLRIRAILFLLLFTFAAVPVGKPAARPAPFQAAETAAYEVKWKAPVFFLPSLHAGLMTLQVHRPTMHEGGAALHFSAVAKSDGVFPKLGGIVVDDSFDSLVSADGFCSRRVVKVQKEGDRKREIVLTFDPENKTTHVLEKDISVAPPRVVRNETMPLPGCAVDVLSVFYAARRFDLEIGRSFNMLMSDNGSSRPITITVEKRESIETGEGRIPALKIRTGSAMGLFSSGGTFSIWYSDDELRLPVKFEAKVSFGRVFGWLKSYSGPSGASLKRETAAR